MSAITLSELADLSSFAEGLRRVEGGSDHFYLGTSTVTDEDGTLVATVEHGGSEECWKVTFP